MTRNLVTTKLTGIRYGTTFDGRGDIQDIEKAAIKGIRVGHGEYIYNLTVYYTGQTSAVTHGASGGTAYEITLGADEFITTVKGRSDPSATSVGHLSFVSNKGRCWGPYGSNSSGEPFVWTGENMASLEATSNMGLLYFSGSYGSSFAHLQATFASFPATVEPLSAIKYEEQVKPEVNDSTPAVLSGFARNLMSSLVTLVVGKDGIVFRTYEDLLCRLPFFRAALKGEFKEASEKTIRMPDDEPEIVSALIEYLYIGSYTYTYDPEKTTISTDKTPVREFNEGSFHVRVYALAAKYDCQPLAEAARKGVAYVMGGLDSVEVMHLLIEMYEKEWVLADWEDNQDMQEVKKRLPRLLRKLYGEQRREMENHLSDCPALAVDLVRLLVLSE